VNYAAHIIFMLAVYTLLVISLDLLVGHLGLLVLCQSAFYAIGAYVSSVLMTRWSVPFPYAASVAIVTTMFVSWPIALAARRLRGDAVVLASFAFLLVLNDVLKNWRGVTGGLDGLRDIPAIHLASFKITSLTFQAILAVALAVAGWLIVRRIVGSAFGPFLHALRDDPRGAVGLRVPAIGAYTKSFCLSSGIAAIAGVLYASYATYISPAIFDVDLSILLLAMVLLGGAATRAGPVAGAGIVVVVAEMARAIGMGSPAVGSLHFILTGLVLIIFSTIRPQGVLGGYEFR